MESLSKNIEHIIDQYEIIQNKMKNNKLPTKKFLKEISEIVGKIKMKIDTKILILCGVKVNVWKNIPKKFLNL